MAQGDTSLHRVKVIAEVAGIVSAAIALIALAVNSAQIKNRMDAEQLQSWQEVVVYSLLCEAGWEGMAFDELHTAYLKKERLLEDFNVPKAEIQEAALTRILIRLMSKYAVVAASDGRYRICRDPMSASEAAWLERAAELHPMVDSIISYVSQNDGTCTLEDVRMQFQDRFDLKNTEYDKVMLELRNVGMIVIGRDGKVTKGLGTLQPPFMGAPTMPNGIPGVY